MPIVMIPVNQFKALIKIDNCDDEFLRVKVGSKFRLHDLMQCIFSGSNFYNDCYGLPAF
jgi:hypothetical protein